MIRMTPSAAVHSTNWPVPRNLSRAKRAAIAPIAPKVPPTWSASHHPERVGVPPNATRAPVPWGKPLAFCPTRAIAPRRSLFRPPLPPPPPPAYPSSVVGVGMAGHGRTLIVGRFFSVRHFSAILSLLKNFPFCNALLSANHCLAYIDRLLEPCVSLVPRWSPLSVSPGYGRK